VTRHVRDPQCPFDHEVWPAPSRLDGRGGALTLRELFAEAEGALGSSSPLSLEVFDRPFVSRWTCACGLVDDSLGLVEGLGVPEPRCPRCGAGLVSNTFYRHPRVSTARLPESSLDRTLSSLGIVDGDVITVRGVEHKVHFEVGGSDA
jgi:hypothetical protein